MQDVTLDYFVAVYNEAAARHDVRPTNKRGMVRRLVNAQGGYKKGDSKVSERQMIALFIYSYKGTRDARNRQILLFSDIADALLSRVVFYRVAMATKDVQDNEQKQWARQAKKSIDAMLTKTLVDITINAYGKERMVPKTDDERIETAKKAIYAVEDKTKLLNLFAATETATLREAEA